MAMAKKARQRISYVLPLANSPGGHRLGVNGLAVDSEQSILYSGGRDGAICAWDLNLDLRPKESSLRNPFDDPSSESTPKSATTFRAQTQAHTHWVNDVVLAKNNTALVSASSDLTVRVWRPLEKDNEPVTIGQHADYVKCLASPGSAANWVASGGLDRRICLWDLNGAGKQLEIEVGDEDTSEKGSVYALSTGSHILAAGGPESIVRLWDSRTGKRITKFVGHTDNVRDILINQAGDMIMTASSDQTVKVWSMTAGRCMHTLTMHNDSVWSLFSEDPSLGVFYSSDRSGLVAKTDIRGTLGELDDGISLALAQENDGVTRVIASGEHIWTATSSSSINRWADVDTGSDIQLPGAYQRHRATSSVSRPRGASPPITNGNSKKEIPLKSILRISNTASFPAPTVRDSDSVTDFSTMSGGRKPSEPIVDPDLGLIVPIHALPEETIEGQHGLVKHKLLNDRRRVLTLDTAGDVLMWDLLKCVPIQSFGKCHLEDVEPEVNTMEAVAPWCSLDTRTGRLAVVLEEYNCFDAEMYADELEINDDVEFREDQRINLGKWILRYIFSRLVDEQIKKDEVHRAELNEIVKARQEANPPISINIPNASTTAWDQQGSLTPRANGNHYPATPGMGIGIATPGPGSFLPSVSEDGGPLDKRGSQASRSSAEKPDYFGSSAIANDPPKQPVVTNSDSQDPKSPAVDTEKESNGKDSSTSFGKKFRKGMSFGTKKLGRSSSTTMDKPVALDDNKDKATDEGSESSEAGDKLPAEKEVEDNFNGVIQKIRNEYERLIAENPAQEVESGITPSLTPETPVLKIPGGTTIIIQEETSGGVKDLYRGSVETVGEDANIIAEKAPMWLGELLLKNKIPLKDPVKVSFILQPYQDILPSIAGPDGNARLNANRMLRVKKILAYVAERIEPASEQPKPEVMKPEDYLDLYCYEQKLPITMSLATLRAHVWKGGADVMLYYKSNGRRSIKYEKLTEESVEGEQNSGDLGSGSGITGAGVGSGTAAPATGGGTTSFVG
ncbi:hypothetical protein sscle_15g103770 [Sclerotinia sclerotiorum 1980 UF-70]|uniref:Uncharacterized protein n=1 Tax=Sclerotinia sclerotiorum (strain ATCC 18683 / 1980 / Ss-1) TaxID=665079 RepID=A0A1D9QKZ6_SCLS1|nr:hypothetical protein sscle_15g103770 [Sclerotinia sclerotiorum 1980 UF-70]